MSVEKKVIGDYEEAGQAARILAQARQGRSEDGSLGTADLAPYDEMHIGGRRATEYLLQALDLKAGMGVLDIGSGIGGPARVAAELYKVTVTGIDLTPGYKEIADALSEAVRLDDRTMFVTGNAVDMPFDDAVFDAAYTIHAGMNIRDKQAWYLETARVLKPGAVFGIYEVMAGDGGGDENITLPLPWATGPETSFLGTPEEISGLLKAAGFQIERTEERRDFALRALERLLTHPSLEGRETFAASVRNLHRVIEAGMCAPWQLICRKG